MADTHEPVEIDPNDRSLLEKIGRLRVTAWATVLPVEAAAIGCWLDDFELRARHWCIFHDGEPVAAARLSFHERIEDVPDAAIYEGLFPEPLPAPIASFNRLVTHPDFRGRGFSDKLDRVRVDACDACGVCCVANTTQNAQRTTQLEAIGFDRIGNSISTPKGTYYAGLLTQPMQRRRKPPEIVRTANNMGWSSESLSEISQQFIRFAGQCELPVLDLGAAFGLAAIPALQAGARVIANDLAVEHLVELAARTPVVLRERLTLLPGKFPSDLQLPDASLSAVHASQLFHFLTPAEILEGLAAICRWLSPGGYLFLLAATPYQATHRSFIPEFESRKANGERWPGFIGRYRNYNTHWSADLNPDWLHVFDDEVLTRELMMAGFTIIETKMFTRLGIPEFARYDGRENLGIIAQKPHA